MLFFVGIYFPALPCMHACFVRVRVGGLNSMATCVHVDIITFAFKRKASEKAASIRLSVGVAWLLILLLCDSCAILRALAFPISMHCHHRTVTC